MAIKPEYFQYLEHFGRTATLAELQADPERADVIALRHDIDHDLDLALEVAHHEWERGLRATYFLLNSAAYWDDPDFHLKCRQLAAYGHEVGLHCNVLAEWAAGKIDDVSVRIAELLAYLREAGVSVVGTSAHGDRLCYRHHVTNYWIWSELRGNDPAEAQRGRCAEGPQVDDPQWQISYPADHAVRRADGALYPLWQVSMSEHRLVYDAVHVNCERYWTDSGGSWSRSGDPLQADLSRGRHQVLMHPWWWRGSQRKFFVISTARCGSKWLANFVERATSARGLHEWTLNHTRHGAELVPDKRTACDFEDLLNSPSEVDRRLAYAGSAMTRMKVDVLEANVYLEPFLDRIGQRIPDAEIIHLFRSGPEVIRSIINRNWYDPPEDHRHPPVAGVEWEPLSQFERACWYYRLTNERLLSGTDRRWQFEQLVRDPKYLAAELRELGIVVHPLLAAAVFDERINANSQTGFPMWDKWPADYQQKYLEICGNVHQQLGYPQRAVKSRIWQKIDGAILRVRRRRLRKILQAAAASERRREAWVRALKDEGNAIGRNFARIQRRLAHVRESLPWTRSPELLPRRAVLCKIQFSESGSDSAGGRNTDRVWPSMRLRSEMTAEGLVLRPEGEQFQNAHLLFSGGSWGTVSPGDGYATQPGEYYRGRITAICPANSCARLFALMYDRSGHLQEKQHVANLRSDRKTVHFSFCVPEQLSHCSLALFFDSSTVAPIVVQTVRLESVPYPEDYRVRSGAWHLAPRRRAA